MTRIVVLGCAGSGKTSFARRLAARTGAVVIDLDALWRAQGDEDRMAFRETMRRRHAADAWISDGNFAALSFDIRLPRADLIIWLDQPRLLCAWRAIVRVIDPTETHHQMRDLGKVLTFIRGFERVNRPLIDGQRLRHGPDVPVIHLASDRDVEVFLDAAR